MTWFKVDDGFWSHPKVLELSDAAVALWVKAGSYCGKHLTDGFVSGQILPWLTTNQHAAVELVTAGLWLEVDGGYEFHDWCAYQDTRTTVEKRRAAWKERQQRHRKSSEDVDEKKDSSYISIPFHSKATRDSPSDSRRESRRDNDETPIPMPDNVKQLMENLGRK